MSADVRRVGTRWPVIHVIHVIQLYLDRREGGNVCRDVGREPLPEEVPPDREGQKVGHIRGGPREDKP